MHSNFIQKALDLAYTNIANNGGPFGAVIVKNGVIIAEGVNRVTATHDPTAHAEMVAIRAACTTLKTFSLKGCTLYTSCEPCPMCLAACYWAHIDAIYYANTKEDAARIGFDDALIYQELALPLAQRKLPIKQLACPNHLKAFSLWQEKKDKTPY